MNFAPSSWPSCKTTMTPNPLSNNWQAKLVSLLIALVIWAYVKNLIQPGFLDQLMTGTFTPGR
jgi:hypothetical protein